MDIRKFITTYGQARLARRLGVTRQCVWQWARGERRIPRRHCEAIEEMTGGRLKARDINPKAFQ